MASAAVLATTGITGPNNRAWAEPFNFGTVGFTSDEPFYVLGPLAFLENVEPFWMYGSITFTSVEPFNFGLKLTGEWTEPFNLMGEGDVLYDPVDLGDGDTMAAPAVLVYGWWLPDVDAFEDLGTMATD